MMNKLIIQTSDHWQPEKEYAFHVLLREMLGVDYQVEYQDVQHHIFQLPNDAEWRMIDGFSPAMLSENIRQIIINQPINQSTIQPISPSPDLFAASFFMLSRWEETNSTFRDAHGRFPAEQSLAFKLGFLDRPVVNEWADQVWETLIRLGWQGERKQRKYRLSISCDVDHPKLWWSRMAPLKTMAGALIKRGDGAEAGYWLKNYFFKQKDPYDVFDAWFDLFQREQIVAQFNFMGERPRTSDCWYPLRHPFVKNLMQKITDRGHRIGFHPSYESFDEAKRFHQELCSIRELSPQPVTSGRQHYLRFAAPQTWQMWQAEALQEDCTLGYPEAAGFRCGICHDYPVFDTEQRKMLPLREKPLLAMDVTLAQYCHYTPLQAIEKLAILRAHVEKHGGDFTLLWHNSSWNSPFWEPWQQVFRQFISK